MQNNKPDELGHLLLNASRRLKWSLAGRLADVGLTFPQWMVLNDIYVIEKEKKESCYLTPASVAERLNVDRPTISGIIERLEKNSWVYRIINAEDRRSYIIMLTDKAKELMSELETLGNQAIEKAVKGFTDDELKQLKQYLQRIIDNLMLQK